MEQLFIYVLKSSLGISIFLLVYWLFLRKETFYHFNRHFLLSGLLASMVLPFIQFSYTVTLPFSLPAAADTGVLEKVEPTPLITLTSVVFALYVLGFLVFLIRHLIGLWKVRRVVKAFHFEVVEGCHVVKTDQYKTSFSIFRYIFLDTSHYSSSKEQQLILAHELAHAKGNHWVDLLVAQLFCSLHWFNPLVWIYAQAIKQNHEFLADHEVLKKGYSGAEYRAALINQSLRVPVFNFSSSFAVHDQIKRMNMMLKKPSSPRRKWTTLLALPLLLLILMAFAKPVYQVQVLDASKRLAAAVSVAPKSQEAAIVVKKVVGDSVCIAPHRVSVRRKAARIRKKAIPAVAVASVAIPVKEVLEQGAPEISSGREMEEKSAVEQPVKISFKNENVNAPLYILDGKETDKLDDSLPVRIESISVLKGGTAIAKYGAKGASGVIIITTKK